MKAIKKTIAKSALVVGTLGLAGTAILSGGTSNAGPGDTEPQALDEALCLRKMSLDLRNIGPSAEEVEAVRSGSVSLAEKAEEYMASERFDEVVFNWYRPLFPPSELTEEIGGIDVAEPARIARHIVVNDLDYREILTGDFTVNEDGSVVPSDNGPGAGVLSTRHYMSAYSGLYRRNWAGRFLEDWTPIVLAAVSLPPDTDEENLTPENLMTDPACSGCHASEVYGIDYIAPFSFCYRENGRYIADCSETIDGKFLMESGASLERLGEITANSKEFMNNTVNFFVSMTFGRELAREEAEFYVDLVTQFRESDYRARTLLKAIVTSPEYCSR